MADQTCKACLVCGSTHVEKRHREIADILCLRSAKFQCHQCQGILYRKNRVAALLSKWRKPANSLPHAGL